MAISRFTSPVSLKKLIGLIDEIEWTALDDDVKAPAFRGLLEKAASERKARDNTSPFVIIRFHRSCSGTC